jgi:predicted kinase
MLIVLSGLPGTGKSAIAEGLGRALKMPILSVDPIESAVLRAGVPQSFETGYAAYLVAEALADAHLSLGVGSVIDAVNSVESGRDLWRALAKRHAVPLRIVVCTIADKETHRSRLRDRERGIALGEPRWLDVERRSTEWIPWPEHHLVLDSSEPVEVNLAAALRYVMST